MNAKTLCNIALSALTFGRCINPKEASREVVKTDFEPNPQNTEYRKKHLGVKKRSTKAPKKR